YPCCHLAVIGAVSSEENNPQTDSSSGSACRACPFFRRRGALVFGGERSRAAHARLYDFSSGGGTCPRNNDPKPAGLSVLFFRDPRGRSSSLDVAFGMALAASALAEASRPATGRLADAECLGNFYIFAF